MMNILVCIKEVPDRDMHIRMDASHTWIETGTAGSYIMNRFDEYALEEAVRIKESCPGVTVDALSVGPDRCRAVIRRALAKGADTGIHLLDPSPGCPAAENVAAAIAAFCQTRAYDLILTGVISEDLMQGITGPLLAARLGIPCASAVIHQRIDPDKRTVQADCELEGGWTEKMSLTLPALLTIQSGINRPRYPSLSNMLRSRKQVLTTLPLKTGTECENTPRIVALSEPTTSTNATLFTGTLEDKAEALIDLLIDRGVIIT
jgi:electron transfer flavoprotein beta subunit